MRLAEHPMDRLKRVYSDPTYGRIRKVKFRFCNDGFEFSLYKNGRYEYIANPVTILIQCENCLTLSTPRKVNHKSKSGFFIGSKYSDYIPSKTLCMGCWNQIRPLVKRLDDLETALKLVRSTKKKFNEITKNHA